MGGTFGLLRFGRLYGALCRDTRGRGRTRIYVPSVGGNPRWSDRRGGHLEENFFELRDELDRLNNTEKEAFWVWADGNNIKLTQDAYSLVKSFQSAYMGSYASREDFAEEFAKMENELPDFALSYFDFSKYADDLFDTDFWYKDGYVFRNE